MADRPPIPPAVFRDLLDTALTSVAETQSQPTVTLHAPPPDPTLSMARPNLGIHPATSGDNVAASGRPTALCDVLTISEGLIYCAAVYSGEYGVGALVIGQGDQPDGQCPAATSSPRRVIDR